VQSNTTILYSTLLHDIVLCYAVYHHQLPYFQTYCTYKNISTVGEWRRQYRTVQYRTGQDRTGQLIFYRHSYSINNKTEQSLSHHITLHYHSSPLLLLLQVEMFPCYRCMNEYTDKEAREDMQSIIHQHSSTNINDHTISTVIMKYFQSSNTHICKTCDHHVCDGCIEQCSRCHQMSTCSQCIQKCYGCKEYMCEKCILWTNCRSSSVRICLNCVHVCHTCGIYLCDECLHRDHRHTDTKWMIAYICAYRYIFTYVWHEFLLCSAAKWSEGLC
jgi:hypothetical protein